MIDRKMFNDNFGSFDKDFKIELIETYLSEYQKEFSKFRHIVVQKDFQNLAFAACNLRGIASYFGDPVVTEQSRRIETITRNNNKIEEGLEILFNELEISHGLMVEELKQIKEELMKDQK